MTTTTPPEVFASEDLAKMLHCSVTTIDERALRGDLPGLKFGHGWIFPAGALFQRLNELALEEARRRGQPAPRPSHILRPVEKRKKTPPALPKLP